MADNLRPDISKHVSAAMRAFILDWRRGAGIHQICEGAFFVTNPETIEASRDDFEQSASFMGFKVMTPKKGSP